MEQVRHGPPVDEVLNDEQKRVMARVIREEEAHREHVVIWREQCPCQWLPFAGQRPKTSRPSTLPDTR